MLALFGSAKDEVSGPADRVVGVLDGRGMIIVEDLRCLKKADAMFLLVVSSLVGVPLEYQHCASSSNLTSAMTRASERAICTALEPTPPEAPVTRSDWPERSPARVTSAW